MSKIYLDIATSFKSINYHNIDLALQKNSDLNVR